MKDVLKTGSGVTLQGWLWKLSGRKTWCRRYFVLEGNWVSYFESNEDHNRLGSFKLDQGVSHISIAPLIRHTRPHCTEIRSTGCVYVLSGDSAEEIERWVEHLREAADCFSTESDHPLSPPDSGVGISHDIHSTPRTFASIGRASSLGLSLASGDNPLSSTYDFSGSDSSFRHRKALEPKFLDSAVSSLPKSQSLSADAELSVKPQPVQGKAKFGPLLSRALECCTIL